MGLGAALGAPGKVTDMVRGVFNARSGETHSGPGSLVCNIEDEYAEVVKMLLAHADFGENQPKADPESADANPDKGDGSDRIPAPPPTQDDPPPPPSQGEQVLVAHSGFPETTELLLVWKFVATGSIFVLLYWFWAFAQ